jgi:predicted ATP-grasp superfamily ATP-dependent carboligase
MNKYGNKKVVYLGEVFDSKREMYRYMDLKLLETCGAISNLRRQVVYELIPAQGEKSTRVYKKGRKKGQPIEGKIIEKAVTYRADFTYTDANTNEVIVEDAKGFRTKEWVIKRKLMLYVHGIKVREV